MRRVECLDGLRGLAALWVLVGHCMILTGWFLPILGGADLGVDLFILLSGFVMVFQYQQRRSFESWSDPKIWIAFWIRRFFRIAPLYYVLLIVALLLGPQIYADRVLIDSELGHQLQKPERYLDSSLKNVLMHLSFISGMFPDYAFRTPLPDWSLSLEMQFYAVFPFLVLISRKSGWLITGVIIAVAGIGCVIVLRKLGIAFPMPSFLPLKIHMFLAGMLIAADFEGKSKKLLAQFALAMLLAALPIGGIADMQHVLVRELLVLGFFSLIHCRTNLVIGAVSKLLGTTFFRWLGELSFSVYLLHLLIMHRTVAWVFSYTEFSAKTRFLMALGVTLALVYSISLITFMLIEKPGQRLGKLLVRRIITINRQYDDAVVGHAAKP